MPDLASPCANAFVCRNALPMDDRAYFHSLLIQAKDPMMVAFYTNIIAPMILEETSVVHVEDLIDAGSTV
jgi:hypothetical protein